jgi:hypothetical protein
MSIPANQIEPGAVYEGSRGTSREVVAISRLMVTYRAAGTVKTICLSSFAQWAMREVA